MNSFNPKIELSSDQNVASKNSAMNKKSKIILLVTAIILFIWFPGIPIKVVPETTLRVMDTNKNPMAEVTVSQDWQHWSFESENHKDERISDTNGFVTFSEKSINVSTLRFLFGKFGELFMTVVPTHASSGSYSHFIARKNLENKQYWGDMYSCYGICKEDEPKEIIVEGEIK